MITANFTLSSAPAHLSIQLTINSKPKAMLKNRATGRARHATVLCPWP